jgi:hypothetical protein
MKAKKFFILLCLLELAVGVIVLNGTYYDTNLIIAISRQRREPSRDHEQELRDATRKSFAKQALFSGVILMMPVFLFGPYIWHLFKVERQNRFME